MHHGVPFDVAFCLDETELFGWNIALGEMTTGHVFDWNTLSWPPA